MLRTAFVLTGVFLVVAVEFACGSCPAPKSPSQLAQDAAADGSIEPWCTDASHGIAPASPMPVDGSDGRDAGPPSAHPLRAPVQGLAGLEAEARRIIASKEFGDTMRAVSDGKLTRSAADRTGTSAGDVVDDLRGTGTHQLLTAEYTIGDCYGRSVASTAINGETTGQPGGTTLRGRAASICLTPEVITRWSGNGTARACALNTVVHELTHAVDDGGGDFFYTDRGHTAGGPALASYTAGSVAQCVYLKQEHPDLNVLECVRSVGVTTFNACSCNDSWPTGFGVCRREVSTTPVR